MPGHPSMAKIDSSYRPVTPWSAAFLLGLCPQPAWWTRPPISSAASMRASTGTWGNPSHLTARVIDATDFSVIYQSSARIQAGNPQSAANIKRNNCTYSRVLTFTVPLLIYIYIQSCVRLDMRYSAESKYIAMAMHVCVQVSVLQCSIIAHVAEDMYTDSG